MTNLEQGIAAVRAGQKKVAIHYLRHALIENPDDAWAWLWLSEVVDDLEKKKECLVNVLTLEPGNGEAQRKLADIEIGLLMEQFGTAATVEEETPPPAEEAAKAPLIEEQVQSETDVQVAEPVWVQQPEQAQQPALVEVEKPIQQPLPLKPAPDSTASSAARKAGGLSKKQIGILIVVGLIMLVIVLCLMVLTIINLVAPNILASLLPFLK